MLKQEQSDITKEFRQRVIDLLAQGENTVVAYAFDVGAFARESLTLKLSDGDTLLVSLSKMAPYTKEEDLI